MTTLNSKLVAIVIVTGFLWMGSPTCPSQAKDKGSSPLDVVVLKSGKSLKGLLFRRESDGSVRFIVRRKWLESNNKLLFDREQPRELADAQKAMSLLVDRIRAEIDPAEKETLLGRFLAAEQERIEKELAAIQKPDTQLAAKFMWVTLSSKEVKSITPAIDSDKRVAIWAWSESVDEIENKTTEQLRQGLQGIVFDVTQMPPDLSDQLPAVPDSEDQWSFRIAIVRYAMGSSIDYQGMGSSFFPIDETGPQKIDMTELISKVMGGSVTDLIADLTNPNPRKRPTSGMDEQAIQTLSREVESRRGRGFRVTSLQLDPTGKTATVESRFLFRTAKGTWRVGWQTSASRDSASVRAESVDRILKDPQVSQAAEAVGMLLGNSGNLLQEAGRFGAATEEALQTANQSFATLRSRYMASLSHPTVFLP